MLLAQQCAFQRTVLSKHLAFLFPPLVPHSLAPTCPRSTLLSCHGIREGSLSRYSPHSFQANSSGSHSRCLSNLPGLSLSGQPCTAHTCRPRSSTASNRAAHLMIEEASTREGEANRVKEKPGSLPWMTSCVHKGTSPKWLGASNFSSRFFAPHYPFYNAIIFIMFFLSTFMTKWARLMQDFSAISRLSCLSPMEEISICPSRDCLRQVHRRVKSLKNMFNLPRLSRLCPPRN